MHIAVTWKVKIGKDGIPRVYKFEYLGSRLQNNGKN